MVNSSFPSIGLTQAKLPVSFIANISTGLDILIFQTQQRVYTTIIYVLHTLQNYQNSEDIGLKFSECLIWTYSSQLNTRSSHQVTKIKLPDIPGRFLTIPDGANSVLAPSPPHQPLAITFQSKYQFFHTLFSTYNSSERKHMTVSCIQSLRLLSVTNAHGI